MNTIEKKTLSIIAKIAYKNAESKDHTLSFCPSFLCQPKRPRKKHKYISEKGESI